MTTDFQKARDVFLAALDRPAEEWDAFVVNACGNDEQLRLDVVMLLKAHREGGSLFDPNTADAEETRAYEPDSEQQGTTIADRFKLLEPIGEGGMGTVWMAQQLEPVKRLVAIKLIKPGMDSAQVLARFEAERQALALMDHPNIAKVFDAGTTSDGRPFFAMELVKGVPITKYCDEHHLTPRQRLELFIPVCHAIQHAHQKGIIHRDIKPSNVLVVKYDERSFSKVIDFGVAKATGQQLTESTLHTNLGAVVGTLEYMSPEQASFNQLDVDTRSDIYSLGVLLYELLAGTPPFTKKDLEKAGVMEMLRVIREQEPSKPSTKLSSSDALPSLSANRGTEPSRLTKLVRGELDWMVMKALEKDRNRRYETANGFAMDVQRYLADEPVLACPPSAGYRLRKFVQRNKIALGAVALVGVTLVAAAAVSTWQAVRAARAEGLARVEAGRANDEAGRANSEAENARTEAAIAKAVNDFLTEDLLHQASPGQEADRDIKLITLVERAAEKVESRFRDQPLVEAAIRHTLGTIYTSLRDLRKAEEQLRRAIELRRRHLGPEHSATLWSMTYLAWTLGPQGRHVEAGKIHAEVLEINRRVFGPDHPSVLVSLGGIASDYRGQGRLAEAEKLQREVYEAHLRVQGPEDRQTLWSQVSLAQTIRMQGRPAEAEKILRAVVEGQNRLLRPEHPHSLQAVKFLADAIRDQDRLGEAERLHREVYEIRKRVLGPDHPGTQRSLKAITDLNQRPRGASKLHWDEGMAQSSKGFELLYAGRHKEAVDHFRLAITALGNVADEARTTRDYRHELGKCYIGLAKSSSVEKKLMLSRALPLLEQLTADFPKSKWIWFTLGEVHALLSQWHKAAEAQTKEIELNADAWQPWYQRGNAHARLGQWEEAVADLTRTLELNPDFWWAWWDRGQAHINLKQWAKALADCERAIELGATVPEVWVAKAATHARLDQPDSAIAALQQAVAKGYRSAMHVKNHEDLAGLRGRDDFKQLVTGLEDKAIAALREAIRLKPDDPPAHYRLGVALEKQGRTDEAIACYRKVIELNPKSARAHVGLGNAFRAQEKWDEAIAEYRRAIEVNPIDVGFRNALALALNDLAWALATHPVPTRRDPGRAVSVAKEAVELNPQEGNYHNTLGVALYRAERWKESVATLEKSMELRKGGDSNDWFFLAMAHWKLGEKGKAREWYDRAVIWMDKNQPENDQLRRSRAEAVELLGVNDKK